jgi:hypothetical protein
MQFDMGCGLARYGNKLETIVGIHLQNLMVETISKVFKNHRAKGSFTEMQHVLECQLEKIK